MQKLNLRGVALSFPLAAALSLCAACGGDSDSDDKSNNGGMSSGGSSGSGNKAGSGNTSGSASGGTTSGGGLSTSLPGDKPLGSLSDAEADQLCKDIEEFATTSDFAQAQHEMSCRLAGLLAGAFSGADSDAAMQAACKVAYDACLKEPQPPATGECEKPDATCTATVDELNACIADSTAALDDFNEQVPGCSDLTMDGEGLDPNLMQPESPESCAVLDMKCPDGPLPAME
jgi:hypothetical protein